MTSTTCNFEWPMDATLEDSTLHRCCEKPDHKGVPHRCRCSATTDAA